MNQRIFNYFLVFIICVAITYFAFKWMGPYALVVIVLWGAILAKPLLEGLIAIYGFFRDAPLKPYQGNYYAFDDQQVRVFEINGALWVVDEDILNIIGFKPLLATRRIADLSEHRIIKEHNLWVYSQQAVLRLLKDSYHPSAARLKLWLLREVYFPYAKKQRV